MPWSFIFKKAIGLTSWAIRFLPKKLLSVCVSWSILSAVTGGSWEFQVLCWGLWSIYLELSFMQSERQAVAHSSTCAKINCGTCCPFSGVYFWHLCKKLRWQQWCGLALENSSILLTTICFLVPVDTLVLFLILGEMLWNSSHLI